MCVRGTNIDLVRGKVGQLPSHFHLLHARLTIFNCAVEQTGRAHTKYSLTTTNDGTTTRGAKILQTERTYNIHTHTARRLKRNSPFAASQLASVFFFPILFCVRLCE